MLLDRRLSELWNLPGILPGLFGLLMAPDMELRVFYILVGHVRLSNFIRTTLHFTAR